MTPGLLLRRALLVALWTVLVVLGAYGLIRLWWRLDESYPLVKFEQSREAQQLVSLRQYATRERLGSFLPPDDAHIALRESMLRDVLERSLPLRQTFEKGRYEARLDRARLDLEDGLASITLFGRVRQVDPGKTTLDAAVELQTHIDVVEFRPDVGSLRAGLTVTGSHVVRAGRGSARTILNPAARFFGGLKIEDWNRERLSIEIPIHLDQQITIPDLTGDLTLPARRIPLAVRVSAVTVLRERLVLSISLEPDEASGESVREREEEWIPLTPEDRARMEREARRLYRGGRGRDVRERLLRRTRELAERDSLWRGIIESNRDVAAIVPKSILQTLSNRVARSYLQGARLDFRPNVRVRLNEQIRVRVLGGMVGAGKIVGDLRVTHLHGRLRVTGNPTLTLLPPNGLEFAAPVRVLEGHGRVKLDMRWDPSFLVAIVCRGFGFEETLIGEIVPFQHVLRTRIRFSAEDSSIAGRPYVRPEQVTVPCEFSDPSYAKVRAALLEQDRLLRCGLIMDPDTVLAKVRGLVRHNVRFGLPRTLFKPFSLPVSLEKEYDAGEFHISARVRDPEVVVRPEYLRFGFGAEFSVRAATVENLVPATDTPIPELHAPPDPARSDDSGAMPISP